MFGQLEGLTVVVRGAVCRGGVRTRRSGPRGSVFAVGFVVDVDLFVGVGPGVLRAVARWPMGGAEEVGGRVGYESLEGTILPAHLQHCGGRLLAARGGNVWGRGRGCGPAVARGAPLQEAHSLVSPPLGASVGKPNLSVNMRISSFVNCQPNINKHENDSMIVRKKN